LTPTAGEMQAAYAGQVRRREEGENRPLMTKRLREREEEEKRKGVRERYPNVRYVSLIHLLSMWY
jgi:tether containing UBX domain for GLUT4